MRGYVRKRGKRFVICLELPKGDDGSRRQKYLSGFRTERRRTMSWSAS